MIKIGYNLPFAHSMMSHLSCRVRMGGIRELLDGKISVSYTHLTLPTKRIV